MPFETLDEWKAYASSDVLEVIRQGVPPSTWDECRNTQWEKVLVFFCENTYCVENLNFLWAVKEYRSSPGVVKAEDIVETVIYGDQPLNLYSDSSAPIDEWYKDEDHQLKVDLFDQAEREVVDSFAGMYSHFQSVVTKAHQELLEEADRASRPDHPANDISLETIDMSIVDDWNQRALKALDVDDITNFYQHEEFVIIKHPTENGQPYWDWAGTQDWAVAGATVQMAKKGTPFDPGKIKVVGVRSNESEYFEKAIARISKKKVSY